ncbi:type I methionyl aminopeptidase [Paramuribaculum intestinale]|uniref:type I methionyl aminopeptidase n=1 Tax=Paramuribaculum intestinale TaxID=2094151 RepID=UPI000FFF042A|nr:type I methionyl aminopeptidase [Paramuribaculum intestinale]RXE62734.1 type I methionyl aminopeptidase [Muribaculaceae bacterium Isolate-004 (NCI)]
MTCLKTPEDMQKMREACALASETLGYIATMIAPGVTTNHIEMKVREFIADRGARAACLGYGGFPAAVCYEVNETVVHGFPSNYSLREGDIIGTDLVVELDGFNGDMCYTFAVGEVSPEVMALCRTTKESLYKGIEACREGNRIGDISNAVQTYCESRGYSVVREMCGHGIGRSMHEDPEICNYGKRGHGPMIRSGMCLCIEPMINLGSRHIVIERDGWTCRTRDRKPSAHYEHTVAVVDGETEVLTSFEPVKRVLGDKFI